MKKFLIIPFALLVCSTAYASNPPPVITTAEEAEWIITSYLNDRFLNPNYSDKDRFDLGLDDPVSKEHGYTGAPFVCTVTSVIDGDSFTCLDEHTGEEKTVNIRGLSAPSKGTPQGFHSYSMLRNILPPSPVPCAAYVYNHKKDEKGHYEGFVIRFLPPSITGQRNNYGFVNVVNYMLDEGLAQPVGKTTCSKGSSCIALQRPARPHPIGSARILDF